MKKIIRQGGGFSSFAATNNHGVKVPVPEANQTVHLRFRRLAGWGDLPIRAICRRFCCRPSNHDRPS